MYKSKLVHWCDVVPNMDIECISVGFFVYCLFVPHVLQILQEVNGPIMIPKTVLKSGL